MDYKLQILKKLMYNPKLRFSDLQLERLTSKHFNYYLKQLVEDELLEKDVSAGEYKLTDQGKHLVSRLDEQTMDIEKQPKISVAILVQRTGEEGNPEYLLNKRLKQPYYGKVGGFTGKLRFGESLKDCAARELLEETGLSANLELRSMVRKLATNSEAEVVQDQIMALFLATEPQGKLIKNPIEHENFWANEADIPKRTDLYNTFLTFMDATLVGNKEFQEVWVKAEGY